MNDRREKRYIDPLSGETIPAVIYLQKMCAIVRLQRFYRHFIKWDRDEEGKPIDPILREGFDRENQIRILYQTKLKPDNDQLITRIQIYDIETLWESIVVTNKNGHPINPITNTAFTEIQFRKIVDKAIEKKLVKEEEREEILTKYGYAGGDNLNFHINNNYSSSYELARSEKKIRWERAQHLLTYYALLGNKENVEKIIYSHLNDIENNRFNINFFRRVNQQLPKLLSSYKNKLGPLQILKSLVPALLLPPSSVLIDDEDSSSSTNDIQMMNVVEKESENKCWMDNEEIDLELESSLLPDYLKAYSAIHACCIAGNTEILLLLLQLGAETNLTDSKSKILPIHLAIIKNALEILKIIVLYEDESHLEIKSEWGTPLEIAASQPNSGEIYNILFGNFT